MGEEVPEHFGAQDLVNPYLEPGFSLQINIAKWILNFAPIESQPGVIQGGAASAEQKTVYLRRAHGVRDQARDFISDELDGVFVIHAPVNPFVIVDPRQQMQNSSLNISWRREIFNPFGIHPA